MLKWRNAFNALALAFLLFVAFLIVDERDGEILAAICGVVCLVFGNLDAVRRFKFSPTTGIDVETVVKEAKDAIEELRALAIEFSSVFVTMIHSEGRWGGGLGPDRKTETIDKIISALQRLGVNDSDIETVQAAERPFVTFDYSHHVVYGLHKELSPQQREEWDAFNKRRGTGGIGAEPSPDELGAFLKSLGFMSGERRERLEDYRHYVAHGRHRRPEVWKELSGG